MNRNPPIKRKSSPNEAQEEFKVQEISANKEPSQLEMYIQSLKRQKRQNKENSNSNEAKITINIKDLTKINRGSVDLPREIIIESIYNNTNTCLVFKNNSGRGDYYYRCIIQNCPYILKITECKVYSNSLSTTNLLANFKSFDISNQNGLDEGICKITEYGEHKEHPNNYITLSKQAFEKKEGNKIFSSFDKNS